MSPSYLRFLPLAGTHGWSGQQSGSWWQSGSAYLDLMGRYGLAPYDPDDPFIWSTGLGGLPGLGHRTWHAAGLNLKHYDGFEGYRRDGVIVVAHSHGGQVAAYAAAAGLKIRTLITVCTPARKDMRPIWERARPNIGYWLHVHSDWSDRWQVAGTMFDGLWGIERSMSWADAMGHAQGADDNVTVPGVGHTGLLEDPGHILYWRDLGWLDLMEGVDRAMVEGA